MKTARLLAAVVLCGAPFAAQAQGVDCEFDYVVQDGDTLRSIALTGYGQTSTQLIFSRNFQVLVGATSGLTPGTVLVMPCVPGLAEFTPDIEALQAAMEAGGLLPSTETAEEVEAPAEEVAEDVEIAEEAPAEAEPEIVAEAPAEEPAPEPVVEVAEEPAPAEAEETVEVAAAPEPEPRAEAIRAEVGGLRLLTADDQPPFSDRSLRGLGMANEMMAAALDRAGAEAGSNIIFVDDRNSHLRHLLVDGSFDVGFPWFRPNCENAAALAKVRSDAYLCENFEFSEPLYEFVFGFYTRRGEYSEGRTNFSDFSGASICRPAGADVKDLIGAGIDPETTSFVRAGSVEGCFRHLAFGRVDAVSADVFQAEPILLELRMQDEVVELTDLSLLQTVHAVAPLGKPGTSEAMAALNQGLIDLKVSGEWFRIVRRHLNQN